MTVIIRDDGTVYEERTFPSSKEALRFMEDFNGCHPFEMRAELVVSSWHALLKAWRNL